MPRSPCFALRTPKEKRKKQKKSKERRKVLSSRAVPCRALPRVLLHAARSAHARGKKKLSFSCAAPRGARGINRSGANRTLKYRASAPVRQTYRQPTPL